MSDFSTPAVTYGVEWLVDARGCSPERLRSRDVLERLVRTVIVELDLKPVQPLTWHEFPGEGGHTGIALLAESHLCVHTFPETGLATWNLYCCKPRPDWPWEARLGDVLGATHVTVRRLSRGDP